MIEICEFYIINSINILCQYGLSIIRLFPFVHPISISIKRIVCLSVFVCLNAFAQFSR